MKEEEEINISVEEDAISYAPVTPTNIPLMIMNNIDGANEEVFRVCEDGSVMWKKDGLLVKALTDKDLGLALACAVEAMLSINNPRDIIAKLQMDVLQPISDLTKEIDNDTELGAAIRQMFKGL